MKKSVFFWQVVGFIFTAIGGVLLHFLYDWTNQSIFIAPISGVNESTWEHMKLLFFPLFIYAIYEKRYFKEQKNYWCIKLIGILTGLITIPVLFYTYNGVIGKSPDWINIVIFFISAAVAFLIEGHLLKQENYRCMWNRLSFIILCFIGLLFVIFTFFTPTIPLFKDPISGTFGI